MEAGGEGVRAAEQEFLGLVHCELAHEVVLAHVQAEDGAVVAGDPGVGGYQWPDERRYRQRHRERFVAVSAASAGDGG